MHGASLQRMRAAVCAAQPKSTPEFGRTFLHFGEFAGKLISMTPANRDFLNAARTGDIELLNLALENGADT